MSQVLPKHRAREYETIFIVNPDAATEVVEQAAGRICDAIKRLDGKLLRAENWGRRRLAYPVARQRKGVYIYLKYLGYTAMVAEVERNLRMLEPVIKFLTIRVDADVDPEAAAVREEDISFVSQFEDDDEEIETDEQRLIAFAAEHPDRPRRPRIEDEKPAEEGESEEDATDDNADGADK